METQVARVRCIPAVVAYQPRHAVRRTLYAACSVVVVVTRQQLWLRITAQQASPLRSYLAPVDDQRGTRLAPVDD